MLLFYDNHYALLNTLFLFCLGIYIILFLGHRKEELETLLLQIG